MIKEIEFIKETNCEDEDELWISYGVMNRVHIRSYDSLKKIKLNKFNDETSLKNLNRLYLFTDQKEKDLRFWYRAKNSNFVFISFYRLGYMNSKRIDEIIEFCNYNDNTLFYYSLDGYDLAIANYSDTLSGLETNMKIIRYHKANDDEEDPSWSALEVNTLIFTSQERIDTLEKVDNSVLSKVSFRFRLKNQIDFEDKIYHKISKLVTDDNKKISYIRNGNYDIELFVENVNVGKFLSLFKNSKENIFNNQNESEMFKIVDEYEIRLYKEGFLPYTLFENKCDDKDLYDLQKVYDKLNSYCIQCNDLYNIIQFMNHSWKNKFINDAFTIIVNPLKMFLKKVESFNLDYALIKISYSKFTEAVNDVFQIMNYSRIHTSRGMSFQGEKMMVPLKLLCYYTTIALKFKMILQESDSDLYSFTISPAKMDDIQTELMFPDADYKNRLLLLKIPIASLYDLDSTMMQIGHEIGHYVCNDTRNRSARLNLLSSAIKEFLFNKLVFNIDFGVHDELKKDIIILLDDKINEEKGKIKVLWSIKDDTTIYRDMLQSILNELYTSVLSQFLRGLNVIRRNVGKYISGVDFNEFGNRRSQIINIIENLSSVILTLLVKNEISKNIEWMLMVCDECFSDLCTIIPLSCDFKDYQKLFIDQAFKQVENKTSDFAVVRMGLICIVCGYEEELKQLETMELSDMKLDIFKLVRKFVESYHQYLDDNSSSPKNIYLEEDDYFPTLFSSVGFYYYICKYLKLCKESLIIQCQNKKEIVSQVKMIYNKINKKDNDYFDYKFVFNEIKEYKDEIFSQCNSIEKDNMERIEYEESKS